MLLLVCVCWPQREIESGSVLNVQVVTKEEVFLGGAAGIQTRVVGSGSEDQQAEEPDGEATLQVITVRDPTWVPERVALVICQGSGLVKPGLVFPEEPHDRLDLKKKEPR